MAFNRRIMQRLEEACEGNEAMKGFMRDLVRCEIQGVKQYKGEYEKLLKQWSREEEPQVGDSTMGW